MVSIFFFIFIVLFGCQLACSQSTDNKDGLNLCQANCISGDRLIGPTRMTATRDHPWKVAPFPTTQRSFCELGCQLFFSENPQNTTCKASCDYYYRIQITTGYSDVVEEARLECRDGCDIGLDVCQAGYYCTEGQMLACLPGTFREPIADLSTNSLESTTRCIECPAGRYRSLNKGQNAEDCSLCPIGKYVSTTGSQHESDCQRCPAGKTAAEQGSAKCICITGDSCDMLVEIEGQESQRFFANDIDYFRETVPFIGRW